MANRVWQNPPGFDTFVSTVRSHPSSLPGHPRWTLVTSDGQFRTAPNTPLNSRLSPGIRGEYRIYLDTIGRVTGMRVNT